VNLLQIPSNDDTFKRPVTVVFPGRNGAEPTQGEFVAEFHRIEQPAIEKWVEDNVFVSTMVAEMLVGVSGIAGPDGRELTPEEGKEAVLRSAECCNAVRLAFFDALGQTPPTKTSQRRRGRG